jgi:hypothetical protein
MWTVALGCAALGVLLSLRFRAYALVPASLLTIGVSVGYGLSNGLGVLSLFLVTMANLIVLQVGYCLACYVVQATRLNPKKRQQLGLWQKHPFL